MVKFVTYRNLMQINLKREVDAGVYRNLKPSKPWMDVV